DVGAGDVVLGTAFVPEWNPTWTGPDLDDQVAINALGILARLGQVQIEHSALRRWHEHFSTPPAAYWPMEAGADATVLANIVGGAPLSLTTGQQQLSSDSSLPGSLPLPIAFRESETYGPLTFEAPLSIPGGQFTLSWWLR